MKFVFVLFVFVLFLFEQPEAKTPSPSLMYNFFKSNVYRILDATINGTKCSADLKIFIEELSNFKLWALEMLDANAKLHSGIVNGNLQFYGTYDQCLSVIRDENETVVGKYCTVPLVFDKHTTELFFELFVKKVKEKSIPLELFLKDFKISFGLCIPESCSGEHLKNLWTYVEKTFKIPAQARFIDEWCFTKDTQATFTKTDVYIFCFFAVVAVVVVGCTLYDIFSSNCGRKRVMIVSFSLYSNTKKLLSTHCENDNMRCMYGIRVLSMVWIIIGHTILVKIALIPTNSRYIVTEWKNRLENSFFLATPYMVDSFLSMSGILVMYVYLKYSEKIKIKVYLFYLHRMVRLMPALAAMILIYIGVLKHVLDGPMKYFYLRQYATSCEKFWWSSLLFVNNYFDFDNQCIHQSWYLSIDSQLYLLFPFIFIYMRKYPNKMLTTTITICLFSVIYTTVTVAKNKFGFVAHLDRRTDDQYRASLYCSLLSRMPPWFIGTNFGHLLYYHSKFQISNVKNTALLIISLGTMLTLVLYQVVFMREDYSVLRSVFFNGFSRSLWSLAVCYIIFSCSTHGHGGLLNIFLSHPVFIVLGKLTYSVFLVHPAVIISVKGKQRYNEYFSNFEIFFDLCGIYVLTLIFSTVLTLFFEAPAYSLLKNLEKLKLRKL